MKQFLFSAQGRFNRASFWKAILYYIGAGVAVGILVTLLWMIFPGEIKEDGSYSVSGVIAVPYLLLIFGYIVALTWSGIVVGIKRYHDRNKSGLWILIQFVPLVGTLWYFIETGFLAGTPGMNRFGPDSLA
jgi:uncharacterized membrane protein YhaH (DUF805 family)